MAPPADDDYRLVVDLQTRFRENGEDEQAAFCDRILDRLEQANGR